MRENCPSKRRTICAITKLSQQVFAAKRESAPSGGETRLRTNTWIQIQKIDNEKYEEQDRNIVKRKFFIGHQKTVQGIFHRYPQKSGNNKKTKEMTNIQLSKTNKTQPSIDLQWSSVILRTFCYQCLHFSGRKSIFLGRTSIQYRALYRQVSPRMEKYFSS